MNFILTFHIISFHHRRWGRDGEYVSTFQWQSKRNGSANLRKKPGDAGDLFRIYCKHLEQHESSRNIRKFCHPTLYRLLWRNYFTTWNISLKTHVYINNLQQKSLTKWMNHQETSIGIVFSSYFEHIFANLSPSTNKRLPFQQFYRLWPSFVQMRLCRLGRWVEWHNLAFNGGTHHTVDGSEIRLPCQLRLVAYPIIYTAFVRS